MRNARSATIAVLVFLLPGLAWGQESNTASTNTDQAQLKHAVKTQFEKLVAAFNARDAQAVMSFFASDVVLSYPGRPDGTYSEIKESFEKMFAPKPNVSVTYTTDIEEVQAGRWIGP
jgi:ketosteroid isomerase-like protein